jgi:NADH-quinone oxidoreductase subunit F
VDEPLAIRALKRYATDYSKQPARPLAPAARGKREVAVIGSGPAGLSCAYFLALLGRASTVYEALPIPGGMLSVGIPEYRLPKRILQADIDFILSHGVELRTNCPVEDLKSLTQNGYRAVFVATGAHQSEALGIAGEELKGMSDALQFLRHRALGQEVFCGKRVVVIGGGNVAVDAARSAMRLGAEKVSIVYRRSREEMPAYEEEVEAALEEGVELSERVAPRRIVGKKGTVTGIELARMQLGDVDERGRRRPIPIEKSEYILECDMVLPALGQKASVELASDILERNPRGGIRADVLTGASSAPGVFAGGDCVSNGATVIEAISAGQKAALAIDRMLGGSGLLPANVGGSLWRPTEEQLEISLPRAKESMVEADLRRNCFEEVLGGFAPGSACQESGRCLRCDLERAASLKSGRGR